MNEGRLTLISGKPIMNCDTVGATHAFYTPYIGNDIMLWNGSAFVATAFSEQSLSLASLTAGHNYDVLADTVSGIYLSSAWTNDTTPSNPISRVNGVNCDASHNTYLGSVMCMTNGQVSWMQKPAAAYFGTANQLGVWNADNRVEIEAVCQDLTTSWPYASSGIRYADNSNLFRIYFIDGLGESPSYASYESSVVGSSSSAAAATVGVGLDAVYPVNWGGALPQGAMNSTALGGYIKGSDQTYGLIGKHYWQAMEESTSVSITFMGNNFSALKVRLAM